ncbi:MAG: cytochrome b/b6 domain-containing protein, partial [Rhodospirillales bacterium]|nr:cytochrome b/b6 domain-containing protein [Rhodospirillales bacterium]
PVRVWDPATRLFHWLLVALAAVGIYTGLVGGLGEMDLHIWCGYGILALVLFRAVWGFLGSKYSRFGDFIRGPRAVVRYALGLFSRAPMVVLGHNPLGGWSVLAMLTSLLIQASTGLFANDDIFTEGPLADHVSKATSDTLTAIHNINANVLFALIALHLTAVLSYRLAKGENLVKAMITGSKRIAAGDPRSLIGFVNQWRAVVVMAGAVAVVWIVVTW